MKRIYHTLLFICLATFMFNCQKTNNDFQDNGGNPITATLQGKVTAGGNPAAGVTITLGVRTTTTDANGYFRMENASLDKKVTVISAEKDLCFKGLRTFSATSGVNHVEIDLMYKQLAGTVDNSTGGSVSLSNGSKIELPAGGVTKATGGTVYTGQVEVYAAYIDPTSASIAQTVPGSFLADDKNGNRVILASYGMLAVELQSPSGEKLQLARERKATITTAIPTSLQSAAPATIPLWYMDESTGLWKEEGTANKVGINYVGSVSHFSYWTSGESGPTVVLSATFVDGGNAPLPYRTIVIKRTNGQTAAWGSTDSLGQVNGAIPASITLVIEVRNPCNSIDHTQNIGPYSNNIALGNVIVSPAQAKTIKGRLLNCSGSPVTNGYAIIWYGNYNVNIPVNATGYFSTDLSPCSGIFPTCKIVGVDNATNLQSATQTVAISAQINDAGNISTCGVSSIQTLSYSTNGVPSYNFSSLTGDNFHGYDNSISNPGVDYLKASGGTQGVYFMFGHNGMAGVFPMTFFYIDHSFAPLTILQPFNVILTSHPSQVGEFYEATFSGQYQNNLNNTYTVNGSFRIRRNL